MSAQAPAVTLQSLQLENERLQRELGEARAELEDFTYSVSHDLRASLRHVNAYVQIIKEDLSGIAQPDVSGYLETVNQAAQQMGRQIDGLMALSRLAQVEVQQSALDMTLLVRDAVASMAMVCAGRVVEWQVGEDFPALQGDAVLVRQAVMYLLENACKFTRSRPIASIHISWQALDTGLCRVTVSDNGVGFNPAYVDKLFHAFQRLHGAREFEGMGMGLALTRKIMERQGGTVQASAVLNEGCSVSFTLPVA